MLDLSIRETRTYVGTYDHLNKHRSIGSVDELRRVGICTDEEDPCEPHKITVDALVDLEPGISDDDPQIVQALRDTFTNAGCHHEYDCCGCWSHYVSSVTQTTGRLYCVEISASRNY